MTLQRRFGARTARVPLFARRCGATSHPVESTRRQCQARRVQAGSTPRSYGRRELWGDGLAGITVAVVLVPQAMAYAALAGLRPEVGLYAATLPAFAYAALGSNRFLSIGPVAIVALLISSGLSDLATPGTPEYSRLAVTLTSLVALIFVALALLRAGFLVNFLSRPTTVGFNAGAAILTAMSQAGPILGIDTKRLDDFSSTWPWPIFGHLEQTHVGTLLVGAAALALLVGLPRLWSKSPAPLIACAVGIAVASTWSLELAVVGRVPQGLPSLGVPSFEWADARRLMPTAISIVVVGYISSMTVGTVLAHKARDDFDANRELWAFGAANLAAALCGTFPVSAGLARASVLFDANARSRLAGCFCAALVVAVLVALAPTFGHLPKAVLAAIVIVAASKLIDLPEIRALLRGRADGWLTMTLTFVATLALGLEEGLAVGVAISLALFVRRTAVPHSAELGRLPGTTIYRNVTRFSAAEPCPQAPMLRIDAPLYFANAAFVEQRVHQLFVEHPDARLAVLDFAAVNDVDATALQSLRRALRSHREAGRDLHFVAVIGPVRDILRQSSLGREIGADHMHRTLLEAAPVVMASVDADYCRERCRQAAFVECDRLHRGPPTLPGASRAHAVSSPAGSAASVD